MNESLMEAFTHEEIKQAMDNIGDLTASGPDGMLVLFYKKFWDMVSEKVIQEVSQVLQGGAIPDGWNETTVVLILKVMNTERIKDLSSHQPL